MVALKHKNAACAALLNPSAPELLVWPSPLKFIADLNPGAKVLLENALVEANKEREKAILKETMNSFPSPVHSDSGFLVGDGTKIYFILKETMNSFPSHVHSDFRFLVGDGTNFF